MELALLPPDTALGSRLTAKAIMEAAKPQPRFMVDLRKSKSVEVIRSATNKRALNRTLLSPPAIKIDEHMNRIS